MASETKKLVYSVKEAAEVLGIGTNSVYALIHSETSNFPVIKISSMRFLIPCQKLESWVLDASAERYGMNIEY